MVKYKKVNIIFYLLGIKCVLNTAEKKDNKKDIILDFKLIKF